MEGRKEIAPKWQYDLDDFLYTTAPYEELTKYADNPFVHQRMLESMSRYASSLGFRQLKSMYKEYKKTVQAAAAGGTIYLGDNPTRFDGQPLELNAGEWDADDSGVRRIYGGVDCVACPHPILPVERLVNIDTGEEKLRLAYRKGALWKRCIVEKRVLASASKVTDLASVGIAVNSETAKTFVRWISDVENLNYAIIPERKSIGRFGYIPGEGFSPYVDGLVFDGEDASFSAMFATVHERGSYEAWKRVAAEARGMSLTAKIVLAASFASPLLQPLGVLPFFVHLWGVDSGTGKTVALMLAASVWGDPALGSYVKTFDSTSVGLELTAAFLNNLPLCLDELQLTKDGRGKSSFDVYKLAQGVGRTRGNRAGGVNKTTSWQNCVLSTGESPITGQNAGAGAVNRVIEIECKATNVVITDGMRLSAEVKRNFGHAGRNFVEKLYSGVDGVPPEIIERYQVLFRELSEQDTTEKQAMAAAAIVLGDELACKWVFGGKEQPITVAQISEFLASKEAVSAGERAYQYLCDWVAQNSNRLSSQNDGNEVLGVLEGDQAYIIRSVFERVLQDAGFSMKAVASWLKQSGKIETRGRNMTRSRRINGVRTECFCLSLPGLGAEEDSEEEDELPL